MNYLKKRFYGYLLQMLSIGGLCLAASSLFGDQIRHPHLVVDTAGNQITIWASRKPVLGSWSTPVIISDTGTAEPGNPQLIVGPAGSVTAVWTFVNVTEGIYSLAASTYTAALGWSTPTVLSTTNDDVVQDFELGINGLGKVVLIWGSYSVDTGNSHLWNSALNAGSWTTTQVS